LNAHLAANKTKDFLEKKGYTYTVSLYGVIFNPETEKHEYRRVEVFINGPPDEVDVMGIKNFFTAIKPYQYYTLWVYNRGYKELFMIEGFG